MLPDFRRRLSWGDCEAVEQFFHPQEVRQRAVVGEACVWLAVDAAAMGHVPVLGAEALELRVEMA